MSPAGGVAALRMAEESEEIITEYTDAQALEDGVLVEVSRGAVNRVTCAVFYHFARPIENSPDELEAFDITPLTATIRAVLGVTCRRGRGGDKARTKVRNYGLSQMK
jgi:hypothetical protein